VPFQRLDVFIRTDAHVQVAVLRGLAEELDVARVEQIEAAGDQDLLRHVARGGGAERRESCNPVVVHDAARRETEV